MQQDITNNMVKVDFYIYSNKLELAEVDHFMGIVASEKRTRESFQIKEFAQDYWILSTGYEPSEDINIQIDKLVNLISNKRDEINIICRKYDALCGFCVIIKCYDDIMPAIYYERNFLQLVNDINADINMDFT